MQIRNAVLQAPNMLHLALQKECGTPAGEFDFSEGYAPSESNELFMNMGIRVMTEGKDFETVYMLFRFVAGLFYIVHGYGQNASMTRVHTMYRSL